MKKSLIFSLIVIAAPILHAQKMDWANKVYTNVSIIKQEGDLLGWRAQIIHSNLQNFLLVQIFEGEPLAPCLMTAKIKDDTIKAEFPSNCNYKGALSGVVKGEKMTVDFSNEPGATSRERVVLYLIK